MTSNHEAGGVVTTEGSYMIGSEPQFQGMPMSWPSCLMASWRGELRHQIGEVR